MDRKEKEKELQRLVSLTFDENPQVRKDAALQLAASNEPAALFALIELSYDKDASVKQATLDILSKKQAGGDKNAISFADLFDKPHEQQGVEPIPTQEEDAKKKQLLSPIEQIFEKKLGKSKASLVKDRMMSTIEKIYMKAVGSRGGAKAEDSQKREKAMQKMLTSYADVLSLGLDSIALTEKQAAEEKMAEVQTIEDAPAAPAEDSKAIPQAPEVSDALEEVGNRRDHSKISQDISTISDEEEEIKREIDEEAEATGEKSIFRKAYDLMMASDGDEEVLFQQSQKMVKQLQDEVDFAFKMAKQRFKAANITHLTELKDGMRSVNTDLLTVKSVDSGEYMRTKTKKDSYVRITVNDDEGSEGVIYLFEGRGQEVKPGMKVKVVKGQVKTFQFSKETAITIGKKGNVYIVL